jgi:hypothetical protein
MCCLKKSKGLPTDKYPAEFDERYEFVNDTQRELEYIKTKLDKSQQQVYLQTLNVERRWHLKSQIISNLGLERQNLLEPLKIMGHSYHHEKALLTDTRILYIPNFNVFPDEDIYEDFRLRLSDALNCSEMDHSFEMTFIKECEKHINDQ